MLCHDPRISNDRTHKVETNNATLMVAEILTRRGRFVDWGVVARVARYADDESVDAPKVTTS